MDFALTHLAADEALLQVTARHLSCNEIDVCRSFLHDEAEVVFSIVTNLDECMARLSACYLELATNDGEFLDFAMWGTEEHCHAIVRTGCRACNDEIDAVLHNRSECLCLPHHCDEGKQDGDDGFLVHILFVLCYTFLFYTTFSWKYLVRGIHVML